MWKANRNISRIQKNAEGKEKFERKKWKKIETFISTQFLISYTEVWCTNHVLVFVLPVGDSETGSIEEKNKSNEITIFSCLLS